jgi:hypothetical protein
LDAEGYVRYRNLPSRFLWLPFAIAMVILINVYTGTLISKLSAPTYRFLANSIDDVAKNNKIRPHLFVNSPVDEYIHVRSILFY